MEYLSVRHFLFMLISVSCLPQRFQISFRTMNVKVIIAEPDQPFWFHKDNVWVRGGVYKDQNYLEKEELWDLLHRISLLPEDHMKQELAELNGCFAFISSDSSTTPIAFTDLGRTYPLFYTEYNDQLIVSTTTAACVEARGMNVKVNQKKVKEFRILGFTTGMETMLNEVSHLQQSASLHLQQDEPIQSFYRDFRPKKDELYTCNSDLKLQLKSIIEGVFETFIRSLNGQLLVVPLSAGYDSRIILAMLKKHNYSNVLCYTYGKKGSAEQKVAKEVAKRLGYKWIYNEYNQDNVQGFLEHADFGDYYRYMSNHTSMFYMEEYYSLRQLKEKMDLPEDCIFLPGHWGGSIAGGILNGVNPHFQSNADIANYIYEFFFIYDRIGAKQKQTYLKMLEESLDKDGDLLRRYENWNYKNRQARFVVNSARIFNFHGFEYRMLLWNKEILDFFNHLPYEQKFNKAFYAEVLDEFFFEPLDIVFSRRTKEAEVVGYLKKAKRKIKEWFMPTKIKEMLFRRLDYMAYAEMTAQMIKDEKKKGRKIKFKTNYNSLLIQWYINNELKKLG